MSDGLLSLNVPINEDNEATILSNAIKNADHRKTFLRVKPGDFRHPEFKAIAWAIQEIESVGTLTCDLDMILLKAKSSPFRYPIEYTLLSNLTDQFAEVSKDNFDIHLGQLQLDKIKESIAKSSIDGIYQACMNPKTTLGYLKERINWLNTIIEKGYSNSTLEFKTLSELMPDYIKSKNEGNGFRTTGFRQLDDKLNEGFKEGKITLVAALPSMGKSSFALSCMKNLSYKRIPVAQFALEMDSMSLISKLLAFNSRIPVKDITKRYKELSSAEKAILDNEMNRLARNEFIFLNDNPRQSLRSSRDQIMILQDRLGKLDPTYTGYMVAVFDLFGKLSDFSKSKNFANDYELKLNETQQIIRELQIHAILVAQINRGAVNRNKKLGRPRMSDIKNSGAFEEVADLILGVHRPFYDPELAMKHKIAYGDDTQDSMAACDDDAALKNIMEIIIMKQRMGVNNDLVNFVFDPETTRCDAVPDDAQAQINSLKSRDEEE